MEKVARAARLPQCHRLRFLRAASLVVATFGCSGGDGGPSVGEVGGASSSGGTSMTASGGAAQSVGGANRGGNSSGGASDTGGAGRGGAATSDGGTQSGGATVSRGGASTDNTGGRSSGGAGGSATGGSSAAAGKASSGGTSSGGTSSGGASTGGVRASGGGQVGGAATGGTKATGGSNASGGATSTGGATATGGVAGTLPALTVYIAGDSTVSTYTDTAATNDQAGWGQMLKPLFNTKVTVVNRAAGGRTAYWFYLEGAVTNILDSIKPGDYFFIQFGTNDQNTTATFTVNGTTYPRFADAQTTFKSQLKQYYLDPTKAKGAVPVLVTPPPRNSAYCNGGNGLAAYATAMKELGTAENVAVLDNNAKTFNYLKAICPKPTVAADETFFKNNGGTIDGTHFQENGARKMAGFIGEEMERINLGLAAYLL